MSDKIYVRRGNRVDLPILASGEPGWCTDTKELFLGTGAVNTKVFAPYNKTSFVSAYQSAGQSLTAATLTKLLFQTENFDNLNEFASSTFTASEIGIYAITAGVRLPVITGDLGIIAIYVNGAERLRVYAQFAAATGTVHFNASGILEVNAGDTIDIYAYNNTAATTQTGITTTFVNIVRVA